jgi:hypothetical protein
MKGQTHSTAQTIQVQPPETQSQAPRPATGLRVQTHVKAQPAAGLRVKSGVRAGCAIYLPSLPDSDFSEHACVCRADTP